jgi:hypothetical protein
LEEGELAELFENVRQLEVDVDASSSVAVDRSAVICGVEALGDQHQLLRKTLDDHSQSLDIIRKRHTWESQVNRCQQWIATTARKLCEFSDRKAQCRPSADIPPSFNDDDEISQVFQQFQNRLSEFHERQLTVALSTYEILLETYSDILQDNDTIPSHITECQKQLLQSYHNLEDLFTYISQLLAQRSIYTEYALRSIEVQREGEKLRDGINKAFRRIMEDSSAVFDGRVVAFRDELDKSQKECIDRLPKSMFSDTLSQMWPSDGPAKPDAQSADQVLQAMNKKQQEMESLANTIENLNAGYTRALACKETIAQYNSELQGLQDWIISRNKALVSARISVTSEATVDLTDEYISSKADELDQAEQESNKFGNERLRIVHNKLAEFVEQVLGQSEYKNLDVSGVASALDKTLALFRQLQEELVYQRELIVTAEQRAGYDEHVAQLSALLQTVGKRLGVLVVTRDALLARDELAEDHLSKFYTELMEIEDELQNSVKEMVTNCQCHYDTFVDKLTKLNPPLSEPEHLRLKLQRLQRSVSQTDETLTTRLKEHSLLEHRLELDNSVNSALLQLKNLKEQSFKFIDDRARWHSSTENVAVDGENLLAEWEMLSSEYEEYKQSTVESLYSQFASYECETTFHGSHFIIHIEKKMKKLKEISSRTGQSLLYAKTVIQQNLDIQDFIAQANVLEVSAIAIRNALTTKGNVEETQEIVAKFVDDVERVKSKVGAKIQFPVRPVDQDTTEQTQQRDQSAESVIQETVNARSTRLTELSSSLQSLLESTERLSRRMSAMQSYKAQVDSSKQWIQSRIQSLQAITSKSQTASSAQDLREYVNQAESLDATVNAYQHVYTSTKNESEVCLKVLQEEVDGSNGTDDIQRVKDIQEELDDLWKNLQDKSHATLLHLHSSYRSKEYLESASNLLVLLKQLLQTMMDVDPLTVDDRSLDEWQTEISRRENRDLKEIQQMIASGPQNFLSVDYAKIQDIVEDSEDVVARIRKQLTFLYDQANINGLRKNYLSNAGPLQGMCSDILKSLSKLLEEETVLSAEDDKLRATTFDHLVSQQQSLVTLITDQKDPFDDVRSLFAFVMSQEHLEDVKNVQTILDNSWAAIGEKSSTVENFVYYMKQICEKYQTIDVIQANIQKRQEELAQISAGDHADIERSLNQTLQYMGDDKRVLEEADEFASGILKLKLKDMTSVQRNADIFHKHIATILNGLSQQMKLAETARDEASAARIMHQFHTDISEFVKTQQAKCKLLESCLAKHDMLHSTDNLEALLTEVKMALAEFEDNLVQAQDTAENLRHRKKSILRRWPQAPANEITQSLDDTSQKLEQTLVMAKIVREVLVKVHENEKRASTITDQLSAWKLAVTQNVMEATQPEQQEAADHVDEMRNKLDNFENTAIQAFEVSCKKITHLCNKTYDDSKMFSEAKDATESRRKAVLKDWNALKAFLGHAQQNVEDNKLNSVAAEKITELLRYVSDTTRHIHSLKLSEPPVTVDVKEFEAIQKELTQTLAKKTKDLDELFAKGFAEDERVARLRNKAESQVTDLTRLIEKRKQETETAEKLKLHMLLIDQLDADIGRVATSVDKLAPQHARLVENQLIKSDLQSMLQSLYQIRDKRGKMIEGQLDVAKKSADQLVNDWRADKRLGKVIDKWHKLERLMHVRGQELEICIQRLDHEFFTKLAAAKTTTSPLRPRRPSMTPSTSSQTRSNLSLHRNSSRISLQSHSSTESHRRYRSRSPGPRSNSNYNSLVKPHPSEYLSDPNSDLDIEVGRIINASPYRLKVKRVPGEVGKYWFGDENPRLVYCRILPSNLVMVRVGGGWVELAQFLAGGLLFYLFIHVHILK